MTTSITFAEQYSVERKLSTLEIAAPRLRVADWVNIRSTFEEPIGLIIEVSSDQYSYTSTYEPRCVDGSFKTLPFYSVYEYFSDQCEGSDPSGFTCDITLTSFNFKNYETGVEKPAYVDLFINESAEKESFWDKIFR